MSVESAFFANQLYKVFGLKIVHETLIITKYSNYDIENSYMLPDWTANLAQLGAYEAFC